jgi:ABC-type amino acid transport substrate-binding protein
MSTRLANMGLAGALRFTGEILYSGSFHAGVLKEKKELLDLIDKGLSQISTSELAAIEARWLPDPAHRFFVPGRMGLRLSAAERAWLDAHRAVRRTADAFFPPFEFKDEKLNYVGICQDYVKIIIERLGLRDNFTPDLTWAEALQRAKGRQLDILTCVTETAERKNF